jgi:lipopolysaccharide export system protein LptC
MALGRGPDTPGRDLTDKEARRRRRQSALERAISARARARRRRIGASRGYSVFVRWFKILLPIGALVTLSLVFLVQRNDFVGGLVLSAADLAALQEGLRLNEPRFTGATDKGEPFSIAADWALPDSPNPSRIELSAVRGEITLEDGRVASIAAPNGDMRPRDRLLSLSGGVEVSTSNGYVLTTETAEADLAARAVTAPGRLTGVGEEGTLDAGSMRAWSLKDAEAEGPDSAPRSGYVIRFEGGVRLVLNPRRETTAAE